MSETVEVAAPALPTSAPIRIEADWTEGGHLHAARHFELLTRGGYRLMDCVGLGPLQAAHDGLRIFTVEARINYLREVMAREWVAVHLRLLDADRVRVLVLLELIGLGHGQPVSTLEQLFVHVDPTTRRAAPMAPALSARLDAAVREHARHPLPAGHHRRLVCAPQQP